MRTPKTPSLGSIVLLSAVSAALTLGPAALAVEPMTFRASPSAQGGQVPAGDAPAGGPNYILDDGSYENSIGLTNQVTSNTAAWLNRFSPATFPETIDVVQVLWPTQADAQRALIGDPVTILLYSDTDGDGNPANAVLVYQEAFVIGVQDGASFETYDLTVNPLFAGPGDVYIGFRDDWNLGGATPANFPAALDQTASQGRSWVAGNGTTGIDVDINNLGANPLLGTIDGFGLPGNWMIRAVGVAATLVCNGPIVGFESGALPVDWSITTLALPGGEFVVSTDNSSAFWNPGPAPEGVFYASANDDLPGSGSDGSADYLYTNVFSLSGYSSASLSFFYHFDATFGHSAGGVEVSGNGGSTWDGEIIVPIGPVWLPWVLDLSAYAGNPAVQVRFHSNDGGFWAAGYAVDAVALSCVGGAACSLTCPANVVVGNDPGQCSADLLTPQAAGQGDCGPIFCSPAAFSERGGLVQRGLPGVSDCCSANGTPGCDNPTCEAAVCAIDSFCCDVEWDGICAGEAAANCQVCEVTPYTVGTTTIFCQEQPSQGDRPEGGGSDCCIANGTPGCDDATCQALICGQDPFCCDTAWDSICADAAVAQCAVCQGGGGGASCSFDITVNDVEPPALVLPADINVGTEAPACTALVGWAVGTGDNCPGVGAPSCAPMSPSTFNLGTTPVNCSVVDAAGNPTNGAFNVTVVDDDAPTATAPDANVGTDDGLCSAVYNYTPGYADNCPGGSTVCVPPSGSTFPLGATPVNCTATDAAGNMGLDSGTVTVFDDEAPVLICPADVFAVAPPGALSWPVSFADPTLTDNCPGATAGCAPPSGDPFPVGTTMVNCSATDGAGLTADCDFDVTVGNRSIQDIPTASTLGLAALALLLAGAAFVALRRHG